MNETEKAENWFSRAKAEADKGIPPADRVTGIVLVVISVLIVAYFAAHQVGSTGFFTAEFGILETVLLYGSLIFWILTGFLDGIVGQRLLSRILDAFGGAIFAAISLAWLLIVFPFEFAYFSGILPDFLRFLVQWISNDIAQGLMVIGVTLLAVASVYCPIAYGFVDKKRFKREK